jgi:hypothetical protein
LRSNLNTGILERKNSVAARGVCVASALEGKTTLGDIVPFAQPQHGTDAGNMQLYKRLETVLKSAIRQRLLLAPESELPVAR